MKVFILVVLSICVNRSVTEVCGNFKTCGACIGFPRDTCVWCSQPNITERCQPKNSMQKYWCKKEYLYDPNSDSFELIKDLPFRPAKQNLSAIQFKPQHMTVKLRPGHEQTFSMSFKHAADFPLDVYYLMDYSYTMNKHVDELKKQSEILKRDLTAFTNNVYFGLGSFIEKPAYPFAGKIHNSYAFRNHLNLTSDIQLFDKVLTEKRNFSNFDIPEAGLDALMQVMACEKEIGWRANVKRIIVLCTDATYHSAGDGKFVLAYKPNDMECHLNATHYYDYSLIQDYPSVSQINKMAMDGKFKIIFATLNSVDNIYKHLSSAIFGAESAVLSKTSTIFDIIKKVYLKSIRYVTIKYQFPPFVELKLSPNCTGAETECEVGHKEVFNMMATLKVTSCPKVGDYQHSLLVGPVDGGLQDKLKIDLEIVDCKCECEKEIHGEPNSPKCSKSGTLQCGICACNLDRSGDTCECDGSDTSKINLDKCKNGNDTRFCSGKGNCKCGKCTCFTGFSGDFCEFDDNSCRRRDNKLCSGNGKCTRGQCQCDTAHWTGDDCGCSTHHQNCYAPHSEEICSGKGECVCNECVCGKLEGKTERYSGVFCEDCEECAEKRCKELESYALCNYLSNKTYCDEQYNQTSNTEVQMLNKSEINTSKWPTAKWCRAKLDKDRSIVFIHVYDKSAKKLLLIIQTDAEEDPKANIWIPVGIAIATVVIIGLLTVLVWKLLVDAMDEREYNKFMEQAKSEGFDTSENPIYQPASVNFANPTYNVTE